MSARFTRRARALTFAGLATIGLAAVAQLAVTPAAVSDVAYAETLSQDPPIKNSEFEDDENDCPGSPAQWGWHFILTGGEASFVELTTTFQTAGVIVTTTFGPPDAKHAFVYTATDDTLTGATALVSGGDPDKVRLVLSHTCDGGGTTSTPTPTPSVSASETATPTPSVSASETATPTPSVSASETATPTPSVSASESESSTPTPSVSASETESSTPTPSVSASETETATPSPSVSGVKFTNTPSASTTPDETVSPTVRGVRATRGPGALPTTGSAAPVGLLIVLGFGLVAAGMIATVAGEPRTASTGGKHRRA